jgi:hypothetical protein
MSASYLETLNREQRLAVEHGVGTTEADDNRALLILAGAGTARRKCVKNENGLPAPPPSEPREMRESGPNREL